MKHVGDDALEDVVYEEYKANAREEEERIKYSGNSNFFSRIFNFYDERAEPDTEYLEVHSWITKRLDTFTHKEIVFEREFTEDMLIKRKEPIELSLTDLKATYKDNITRCDLNVHSKIAILRALMLKKQVKNLREVMRDTYADEFAGN